MNVKNVAGFEPIRACCGQGGEYNNQIHCGRKVMVDVKEIMVGKACKDLSLWVNWNGFHYTQAANRRVSDLICRWFIFRPTNSIETGLPQVATTSSLDHM